MPKNLASYTKKGKDNVSEPTLNITLKEVEEYGLQCSRNGGLADFRSS